jgi:hypothetical protein
MRQTLVRVLEAKVTVDEEEAGSLGNLEETTSA